jgi:hypothetical protein
MPSFGSASRLHRLALSLIFLTRGASDCPGWRVAQTSRVTASSLFNGRHVRRDRSKLMNYRKCTSFSSCQLMSVAMNHGL